MNSSAAEGLASGANHSKPMTARRNQRVLFIQPDAGYVTDEEFERIKRKILESEF